MLPDIDLRLANTLKALTEVVLPALPADAPLAREQAQLAIAHLGVVARQWKDALAFERESLDAACRLARDLAGRITDAVADAAHVAALTAQLERAAGIDRTRYDAVSTAHRELVAVIAEVIAEDRAAHPLAAGITERVLAYAERQALRERAWFAACGLDPDRDSLPSLDTLAG